MSGVSVIGILQIGDIHFPELKAAKPLADVKDKAVSPRLVSVISLPPLQMVVRELQRQIDNADLHCIAFMGDMTSLGDIAGYQDCIKFFTRSLLNDRWADLANVVVVPGNHDVNRKNANSRNIYTKFEAIRKITSHFGLSCFPHDSEKCSFVCNSDGVRLPVFALNTCLGCGEKRYLPKVVRGAIDKTIRSYLTNANAVKSRLRYVVEQLDTPAVASSTVESLCAAIRKLEGSVPAVVCGHHNILPQVIPRINIYTELMNSGMLRKSLLKLNRPILFLHGHVHDDPIDIVRDPTSTKSILVSVSAPLLSMGFNIVKVAFNKDHLPIGGQIQRHRVDNTGQIAIEDVVQVTFWSNVESGGIMSEAARAVFTAMKKDCLYYVSDLTREVLLGDDEIADALVELRWLGLASIDHLEYRRDRWQIRRIP